MPDRFKTGDHVRWQWGDNLVHGTVKKVHKKDFDMYGQTHHCSPDDPQYEVESDNGGDPAIHKGSALTKD